MTATPNGTVVLAFSEAALDAVADPVDLTEAVKVLYDHVVNSMDWGSGFLDHEEQHRVVDIGKTLGFERPEYMSCHYWTDDDGTFRLHDHCRFEGIDDDAT